MMASVGSKIRLALVQLAVTKDKHINVQHACHKIREAVEKGAQLVCLPECFNSPYGTQFFPEYSEAIPGETSSALSVAAKSNGVVVVGGSFPECDGGKLYNTTLVFGTSGQLLAKHRKVHLFDISIPGKITFRESDALSPGNSLTTVDLPFCKIGLGICYDIRFAEMAQVYAQKGCHLLLYPGAFNMTTGPAHWELLQRARALDNQLFVATISPARDATSSYVAWGHSMVVDPWGTVIAEADHTEQIIYADLDLEYLNNVRQQIPISKQRRDDLYSVVSHDAKQKKLEN